MKKQEDKTTRLILEISNYVHKYGEFPRRGTLSIDGIDMGKAIYINKRTDCYIRAFR